MFKELTKVQINSERNVTLAIRITDQHVHNFIISLEHFTYIMSAKYKSWSGPIHQKHWQVQKLKDRVKFFDTNYEYIYRFSLEEWETIRKQFTAALRKNNLA